MLSSSGQEEAVNRGLNTLFLNTLCKMNHGWARKSVKMYVNGSLKKGFCNTLAELEDSSSSISVTLHLPLKVGGWNKVGWPEG